MFPLAKTQRVGLPEGQKSRSAIISLNTIIHILVAPGVMQSFKFDFLFGGNKYLHAGAA
jgi:hypothetical protein